MLDLQIIDLKKQNDLYHAKIVKKQQHYDKLSEEYQKLVAYKNEKAAPAVVERPPETMEEDQNRKVRMGRLKTISNDVGKVKCPKTLSVKQPKFIPLSA